MSALLQPPDFGKHHFFTQRFCLWGRPRLAPKGTEKNIANELEQGGQEQKNVGDGPNTVSESTVSNTELSEFFALTEFRAENSVSSSQPIICVPKRTHRVFRRTHRVCPNTQRGSVSSLLRNSTLETVFHPFPRIWRCIQDVLCHFAAEFQLSCSNLTVAVASCHNLQQACAVSIRGAFAEPPLVASTVQQSIQAVWLRGSLLAAAVLAVLKRR